MVVECWSLKEDEDSDFDIVNVKNQEIKVKDSSWLLENIALKSRKEFYSGNK